MKTFLLSLAGAFCALILFIIIGFSILSAAISSGDTKQPGDLILTLDMRNGLPDQAPAGGLAALFNSSGYIDVIRKLHAAADDDDVRGVYIRASEMGVGSSRAEELRDAILKLKANEKFVIAHSQGMFGTGPSALRAISAADEMYIQPGTDVMVSGVSFETQFLAGLFEKLSLQSEIIQFYEYKNSPNQYNQTTYTAPHREAMTALGASIWEVSLTDIAADRGLGKDAVRTALESDVLSAEEAIDAKLFDELGWPETVKQIAEDKVGEDANFLSVLAYEPPTVKPGAPLIAIIGGEGPIVTGSGAAGTPFDAPIFGSDRIAGAFIDAAENDKVKAIVFRVDSPGGSPTASDQILNAVAYAQSKGKPVVVSMGSVAASGGYYVSAKADHIVANRTTITGSIGIFGGKITIDGGLERLGINSEDVTVGGAFADAWGTDAFTDPQREMLRDMLQRGYDRFLMLVGEGREMTRDEVHEVARGRVWSGVDAEQRGLVDTLGGFMDALDVAAELAELEDGVQPRLIVYGREAGGLNALSGLLGASAEAASAGAKLNTLLSDPQVAATLQQLQAVQSGQSQVSMTPIRER